MQNKITLVIAPKRAGKTHQVSIMVKDIECVAIFDLVRDSQYIEGAKVIIGRPADFAREIAPSKKTFRVVYQPSIRKLGKNLVMEAPEFQPLLKLCHLRGGMTLVIDEAHLLCNSRNCPEELALASYIGGHKEFSMILVAQSFTGIHPIVRRNVDEIYMWRIVEPADIEAVRDRCGRIVSDQVENLRSVELDDDENFKRPGQMLHWSKSRGVIQVTE